ncbi:DsbA family protein (plasmid) [Halobaculum sp. CBA1158]|uniref:DsbA family protein n=1 Tax=Halobaculum sp. CBA1158 TaxID=2904243 RepID=UPI001F443EC4|nr:thioredoxin domain-containing protein [Halobaculum sp. CBA1158]UIP01596.1 DsbA family protein [Halobaculum sp. CBA1158]
MEKEPHKQLYRHWLAAHPDDLSRVDSKRADAAVDSLTFTERLSEGGVGTAVGGLTRRQLLLAGGGSAAAALVVGGSVLSDDPSAKSGGGTNANSETGVITSAPIPESPSEFRYATMGSADAEVTVTYFGSWKCPYCAQFSTGMLSQLVADYVEPGDIALEFRDLAYFGGEPFLGPDAPAAGQAGLAVWNAEPASYWAFHEYVFQNQPPEREQWATADKMVQFARSAGVSETDPVRTAIQENQYTDALRATDSAAENNGISSTPALLIDGTTINPLGNGDRTRQLIEDAIGSN